MKTSYRVPALASVLAVSLLLGCAHRPRQPVAASVGGSPSSATAAGQTTASGLLSSSPSRSTAPATTGYEPYSTPPVEGSSIPGGPTSPAQSGGRSSSARAAAPAIHVGGPTLGTNGTGVWNNWGCDCQASEGRVTPVGRSLAITTTFYLVSPSVRSAKIVSVGITPTGGPFHVSSDGCTGQTIAGAPDPGAVLSLKGCDLTITFAPVNEAPAQPGYVQGFFVGHLNFAAQESCTNRADEVCKQIPAARPVDAAHPVTVSWQRIDDPALALYGSTQCPPPGSGGVDGCPTTAAFTSSPPATPTAPATSAS